MVRVGLWRSRPPGTRQTEGTSVDGGRVNRQGTARLVALCAILLGLFLMHGSPATAIGGCHGGTGPAAVPMQAGHASSTMARTDLHGAAGHGAPAAQAAYETGTHGATCVSTPVRVHNHPLPTPALLTAGAVAALATWSPTALRATGGTRRRGPPERGRDLLFQVCVART